METRLIQLTHSKADQILKDLEDLNVIKVLEEHHNNPQKLSDKYRGIISKEKATELNLHIEQMRNEWNSI